MGFVLYKDASLKTPVLTRYVDVFRQFPSSYKGNVRAATRKEVEEVIAGCDMSNVSFTGKTTKKTLSWNSFYLASANRNGNDFEVYHFSSKGEAPKWENLAAITKIYSSILMVSDTNQAPFVDLLGNGKYYASSEKVTLPTVVSTAKKANGEFITGKCVTFPKEFTESNQCDPTKDKIYPEGSTSNASGLADIGKIISTVKYPSDDNRAIKIGYLTVPRNDTKKYYYDKSKFTVSAVKIGNGSGVVNTVNFNTTEGSITLTGKVINGVMGAIYITGKDSTCFNSESDTGIYVVTYTDPKYTINYWKEYQEWASRTKGGYKPMFFDEVSQTNLDERNSYRMHLAPTLPADITEEKTQVPFKWTKADGTTGVKYATPVEKIKYTSFKTWMICSSTDKTEAAAGVVYKVSKDLDWYPVYNVTSSVSYTIPAGEEKAGYTFKHWRLYRDGVTSPYDSVEYKAGSTGSLYNGYHYEAVYEANTTYTVTYKVLGTVYKTVTGITEGSSHTVIAAPSLPADVVSDGNIVQFIDSVDSTKTLKPKRSITTKYTAFTGWYDGTQSYKNPNPYTVRKNVTFEARFTTTQTVKVKVPTPDAKSGYTFKYYKDSSGKTYNPDTEITNPYDSYTGVWEKDKPDQVTATYKDDADNQVAFKTYDKGSSQTILNWSYGDHAEVKSEGDNCEFYDPISKKVLKDKKIQITNKDYKFSKWKFSNGSTIDAGSSYTFSKNETLTAVFTYSTVKQVTTHSAVVLDGYQFEGWKCLADGKVYGANKTITDPASGRYEAVLTKVKKYSVRYYKEKADITAYKTFTVNEGDIHKLEAKLADIPASTGKGANSSTVTNNINKETVSVPQQISTTAKSMTFWQIGDTKPDYTPKDPIVVNGDINIYPKWTGGVNTYTFVVPEPKQYTNYTFVKYTYVDDSGKTVTVSAGDRFTTPSVNKIFEILATYTPNKKSTVGRLFLIKGSDGATSTTTFTKKLQELVGTDWTIGGSVRSFDIPRTWKIPVYSKDGYNQKRWVYVHYVPDGWEMWRFNWNSDGSDFGVISWKDNTFYALSIPGSIISGSDSLKRENIFTATSDLYDNGITGGCTRSKKTEADDDSSVPSK